MLIFIDICRYLPLCHIYAPLPYACHAITTLLIAAADADDADDARFSSFAFAAAAIRHAAVAAALSFFAISIIFSLPLLPTLMITPCFRRHAIDGAMPH